MSNTFAYIFNFQIKNNKIFAQINNLNEGIQSVGNSVNQLSSKISNSFKLLNISAFIEQVNAVSDGLNSIAEPGLKVSSSMAELSAMTGVAGKGLDQINQYARENAKQFGTSAAASLDSYKVILSKLTPEIAKSPKALKSMGDSVSVLSKTMGGDTAGAVDVLTTAMNQFQVSTDNPVKASAEMSKMMNVMAAAAAEGSAEIVDIKAALEQSGLAAKTAGVSFEETNAAIQVLDKAGKKGSEGGVALRNVMTTLAQGRFLPKDVQDELSKAGIDVSKLTDKSLSLTDRLTPLKTVMKDSALFTKLFGKENVSAATALVSGIDEVGRMSTAIKGTNAAYEQAAIIMESPEEKSKRLKAAVDDFKISIFEASGGLMGYVGVIGDVGRDLANLSPLYSMLSSAVGGTVKAVKWLKNSTLAKLVVDKVVAVATKAWAAAQWALNVAMEANPLGLVIAAVAVLVTGIYALTQAFKGVSAAQQVENEVKQRVIDKTADQRAELEMLFNTLKSAKKGSDEYNETLKRLEEMQPGIVEKYNLQAGALKDINAAQQEMVNNIDAIAKAEAYKEVAKEKYKEAFKKKQEGPGFWDYTKSVGSGIMAGAFGTRYYDAEAQKRGAIHNAMEQAKESSKAAGKHMNSKGYKQAIGALGKSNGITPPVIPGVAPNKPDDANGSNNTTGNAGSKTNESIATGGTKNTVINITFKNMVEGLTVTASGLNDFGKKVEDEVANSMMRVLAMANTQAG